MTQSLTDAQFQRIQAQLDELSAQIITYQNDITKKQAIKDALANDIITLQGQVDALNNSKAIAEDATNKDLEARVKACTDAESALKAHQEGIEARETALQDQLAEVEGYKAERDSFLATLEQQKEYLSKKEAYLTQKEADLVSRETAVTDRETNASQFEQVLIAKKHDIDDLRSDLDKQAADQKDTQAKQDAQAEQLSEQSLINTQKESSLIEISNNIADRETKVAAREEAVTINEKAYESNVAAMNIAQNRLDLGWLQINGINDQKQLGLDIASLKANPSGS